ncbi:MAG: hypothetical protein HUK03_09075, partial [Bacteroidaceae bacterium]|nr:hypothetical protein [Bacteroidaceae bacterium]
MKKTLIVLLLAVMSLTASAQFEKGTNYANLTLSGIGFSYNNNTKFCVGIDGVGGHFVEDGWMLKGVLGYSRQYEMNDFHLGAGFRYYFQSNGIFMGAGFQYQYMTESNHYVQLTPEIGYCFYINRFVSIEPALYYNVCLNDFRNGSTVG